MSVDNTIQSILQKRGKSALADIRRNIRKFKATGKTANSLFLNAQNTRLQIGGSGGLSWLETGRPPAKSSSPKWDINTLLEWMKAKNIGSGLSDKERQRLAQFIKYRINQRGTVKWQQGKGAIVDDVYTTRLSKLTQEIGKDIEEIEGDFALNVKEGKNIKVT